MTTTKKIKIPQPRKMLEGDWLIHRIFEKYTSREFLEKFQAKDFKFDRELQKEYSDVYMNGVGLCTQEEFFNFVMGLRQAYNKKFDWKRTREDLIFVEFMVLVTYVSALVAPKFHEQYEIEATPKLEQ